MEARRANAKTAAGALILFGILGFSLIGIAGSLEPSGPPGPTMKTLDEVEPGTAISSAPYTVSEPGYYYLAGNVQAGSGLFHGITIWADNVTLDLKGFALTGEGTAGKHGIIVEGSHKNIRICNGTVRGWGGNGIEADAATNSQLEKLRLTDNGAVGMRVGEGGIIKGCTSLSNGDNGIESGRSCTITECTARSNSGAGFSVGGGGTIANCSSSGNTGAGILCRDHSCTVTACTALANTVNGITVPDGSTVNGCTTSESGAAGIDAGSDSSVVECTAASNSGNGIQAAAGCTVKDCTASANGKDGIEVENNCIVSGSTCSQNGSGRGNSAGIHVTGSGNRIEGNNVTDNDVRGIDVDGTENIIVKNTATAHIVQSIPNAYTIVSGNAVGQILSAITSTYITSSNPWANFYYSPY